MRTYTNDFYDQLSALHGHQLVARKSSAKTLKTVGKVLLQDLKRISLKAAVTEGTYEKNYKVRHASVGRWKGE